MFEKPIVFFAHSSKNKSELLALKAVMDERCRGAIDFFLSCDGQSIPFGRNWSAAISDALQKAKLLFCFISREAKNTWWIPFEAGRAERGEIQVVPVCLPGMDFECLGGPLDQLQGFYLHDATGMTNLVRICNDCLDLKMDERFSDEDFVTVFGSSAKKASGFFRQWTPFIDNVGIWLNCKCPPSYEPHVILKQAFADCAIPMVHRHESKDGTLTFEAEAHGMWFKGNRRASDVSSPEVCVEWHLWFGLTPQLFEKNAAAIDKWFVASGFAQPLKVNLRFRPEVVCRGERHHITTKLYGTGITLSQAGRFKFGDLEFALSSLEFQFDCAGSLTQYDLFGLLSKLFGAKVLEIDEEASRRQAHSPWGIRF